MQKKSGFSPENFKRSSNRKKNKFEYVTKPQLQEEAFQCTKFHHPHFYQSPQIYMQGLCMAALSPTMPQ